MNTRPRNTYLCEAWTDLPFVKTRLCNDVVLIIKLVKTFVWKIDDEFRCVITIKSINQSTNRPTDQSIKQPTDRSIHRSTKRSIFYLDTWRSWVRSATCYLKIKKNAITKTYLLYEIVKTLKLKLLVLYIYNPLFQTWNSFNNYSVLTFPFQTMAWTPKT